MKTLFIFLFIIIVSAEMQAQTIVGKWQLLKQSSCIEDDIDMSDTDADDLIADMNTRGNRTSQVIEFKDNNTGEESNKILTRKKSYNSKSFLYKFNGSALYILDKKSRTIVEGFTVEKFTADSLVISNAERACDTKVFVKIK